MRSSLLILAVPTLLVACKVDNSLNKNTDGPAVFDTGDSYQPPVDTAHDSPVDSADTTEPPSCDDRSFPALAIPQLEECYSEGTTVGSFTPVLEWTNSDPGDTYTTPVIGQLTDDNGNGRIDDGDTPDIVVANTAGVLWAISGDGTTLWRAGSLGSEPMTAAIGDLDGDGVAEVVGSGPSGSIAVYGDGTTYWNSAQTGGQCGAVGIADLDGDGAAEVLLGAKILNGQSGALLATGAYGTGSGYGSSSVATFGVAADIDRDGIQEVVVGNALYDIDGNTLWTNGQSDGFVAVGDFDGDAQGEIVVSNTGSVRLQDDDGTVLWSGNYTGSTSGPPTIADFDGDGEPEIGVAGHNSYVVIETDGAVLWTRAVSDSSSGFTGSSVFDFEGDGIAEVVYADENDVYVLDGPTGAIKLQEATHSSATCSEYPAVADVDGDGHAEIIYTSSSYSGPEQGVRVIGDADDSWQPGRKVWNQHAYSITNVEDDATIPVSPDANWDSYNNFRSGDLIPGGGGYAGPDLYPYLHAICVDECDSGNVTLWYSLGNQGYNDLDEAVRVEFWGETSSGRMLLGSETWTAALPAGMRSQAESVELTGVPALLLDIIVEVDGGDDSSAGVISECYEDNNTAAWGDVVCY